MLLIRGEFKLCKRRTAKRYILVGYEDTPGDLFRTVVRMYNFKGLRMDSSIKKWILRGKSPDVKKPPNPNSTYPRKMSKKSSTGDLTWTPHS